MLIDHAARHLSETKEDVSLQMEIHSCARLTSPGVPKRPYQASEFKPSQEHREIRSLTGLRGVAALFIVMFHFMEVYKSTAEPAWSFRQIVSHGYLSVDLFFVLSGFVMALNYGEPLRNNLQRGYKAFIGHRIARIYPLYLLITLVGGFIHASGFMHAEVIPNFSEALLANLLMVQSWGLAQSFVWPAWSISTEWTAYLLFPLLLAGTLFTARRIAFLIAFICIALLPVLAWTNWWGIPFASRTGPLDLWEHESAAPILRCLAEFTIGLLTYRVFRASSAKLSRAATSLCPVVSIAIILLFCLPDSDVAVVMLFPVLILGLAWDRGIVARLLSTKIAYATGVFSYSLYLIHPYFAHIVDGEAAFLSKAGIEPARFLASAAISSVTLVVAGWVFRLIERPSRRIFRRVIDRSLALG